MERFMCFGVALPEACWHAVSERVVFDYTELI